MNSLAPVLWLKDHSMDDITGLQTCQNVAGKGNACSLMDNPVIRIGGSSWCGAAQALADGMRGGCDISLMQPHPQTTRRQR